MIKVNLLRNAGLSQGAAATGAPGGISIEVTPELQRLAVGKICTILLFPLLLYVWEKVNLSVLQDKFATAQGEVQKIQAEKGKFGDAGPRIERYNKEKQRIDKELEVIRVLSRNRLRELKALDAIQNLITGKTWVRKIAIEGNVVKMEAFTQADDGITELIKALENSVYFSHVEPKGTSQENFPTGPAKKFELEFKIGKSE